MRASRISAKTANCLALWKSNPKLVLTQDAAFMGLTVTAIAFWASRGRGVAPAWLLFAHAHTRLLPDNRPARPTCGTGFAA